MLPGDAPHAVPDDAGAEGGSQPAGRAVGPGVGEVLRGKFDADGAFRPLTAAEARDRGIPDYDPETGKGRAGRARGCGGSGYEPDADD